MIRNVYQFWVQCQFRALRNLTLDMWITNGKILEPKNTLIFFNKSGEKCGFKNGCFQF